MVDIGRLFHIPDRRGYRTTLDARVKRDGLTPLSTGEAHEIAVNHRLGRAAASEVARSLADSIANGLSVGDFKDGKTDQLRVFAQSLGIEPAAIASVICRRAESNFTECADRVVASGECTPERRLELRELGRCLGLSEAEQDQLYIESARPAVAEIWDHAVVDDMLSPEAEAAAHAMTSKLNVTPQFNSGTLATKLDRAKRSWTIAFGTLPVIEAAISLQRAEVAHAVVAATAYQTATRTKSVGYGGPGLRIRIAKGVYYRAGQYQVHRQTEQFEKNMGHGTLVATNKRLIFIGPAGATSARLDSILHIEPFTNALTVIRSSGRPMTYRFDGTDEWFGAILARAIHDATAS